MKMFAVYLEGGGCSGVVVLVKRVCADLHQSLYQCSRLFVASKRNLVRWILGGCDAMHCLWTADRCGLESDVHVFADDDCSYRLFVICVTFSTCFLVPRILTLRLLTPPLMMASVTTILALVFADIVRMADPL